MCHITDANLWVFGPGVPPKACQSAPLWFKRKSYFPRIGRANYDLVFAILVVFVIWVLLIVWYVFFCVATLVVIMIFDSFCIVFILAVMVILIVILFFCQFIIWLFHLLFFSLFLSFCLFCANKKWRQGLEVIRPIYCKIRQEWTNAYVVIFKTVYLAWACWVFLVRK